MVLEVEQAEECEELRMRRYTMDDEVWWEAMEIVQLVRNDLVPGYHAAPPYTSDPEDN